MPGSGSIAIQVTQRQFRQLSLFKGRKQRGTLPPAPSEFASQVFLVDVIRRWLDPRCQFTHIASGECPHTPMKKAPDDAGALELLN